jgi:hypothetical protein
LPRIDVPSLEAEARPHPKNGEGKFLYAAGRPAMEGEKTVVRSPTSQGTEACFSFRFSIFVSTVDEILPSVDKLLYRAFLFPKNTN